MKINIILDIDKGTIANYVGHGVFTGFYLREDLSTSLSLSKERESLLLVTERQWFETTSPVYKIMAQLKRMIHQNNLTHVKKGLKNVLGVMESIPSMNDEYLHDYLDSSLLTIIEENTKTSVAIVDSYLPMDCFHSDGSKYNIEEAEGFLTEDFRKSLFKNIIRGCDIEVDLTSTTSGFVFNWPQLKEINIFQVERNESGPVGVNQIAAYNVFHVSFDGELLN